MKRDAACASKKSLALLREPISALNLTTMYEMSENSEFLLNGIVRLSNLQQRKGKKSFLCILTILTTLY